MIYTMIDKRKFDVNNPNDLKVYQNFIKTNSWKNGCPFFLEWPHVNVPDMIKDKIVKEHLSSLIKSMK